MKPAPFDYIVPATLAEALGLLHELEQDGVDVKVMAGGQSLMPLMNMRLAMPAAVIDLNGLEGELGYLYREGDTLRIGALTRHYQLEDSPVIAQDCPVIREAESLIGHPQIRSRGTIGGSLCHADPSAELPLIFTLLDGRVTLNSVDGERVVGPADFFLSYLMTEVSATEIATEVRLPALPAGAGQAIEEFSPRHGDFAIAAVACQIALDAQGRLAAARLAVGGASSTPKDVSDVLNAHQGERLTDDLAKSVLDKVMSLIDPLDDLHATAQYRLDLVRALGRSAIAKASQRARGQVAR